MKRFLVKIGNIKKIWTISEILKYRESGKACEVIKEISQKPEVIIK